MAEEMEEAELFDYDHLLPPGEPEEGEEEAGEEDWEIMVSCGCAATG